MREDKETNKSKRKAGCNSTLEAVRPPKLRAKQNPLECIPVAPPQPKATRLGRKRSETQDSFSQSLSKGRTCRGREVGAGDKSLKSHLEAQSRVQGTW